MTHALSSPAPPGRFALSLGEAGSPSAAAGRRALADEERGWIRDARNGDAEAFRRLVDRYRDVAYEVALRIVRTPEEAEEVAQDAFVRAWRALSGFREEALFSTWLYRIVTRRALDVAGSARRRPERTATELSPDRLPDPLAPGVKITDALRLRRVLAELAPVRRAVVTLFYLRDCPVDEVAEVLGMPAGTVKTHLHRARAELRRAWRRHLTREERHGLSGL